VRSQKWCGGTPKPATDRPQAIGGGGAPGCIAGTLCAQSLAMQRIANASTKMFRDTRIALL
jgi:hypothetical protein